MKYIWKAVDTPDKSIESGNNATTELSMLFSPT